MAPVGEQWDPTVVVVVVVIVLHTPGSGELDFRQGKGAMRVNIHIRTRHALSSGLGGWVVVNPFFDQLGRTHTAGSVVFGRASPRHLCHTHTHSRARDASPDASDRLKMGGCCCCVRDAAALTGCMMWPERERETERLTKPQTDIAVRQRTDANGTRPAGRILQNQPPSINCHRMPRETMMMLLMMMLMMLMMMMQNANTKFPFG